MNEEMKEGPQPEERRTRGRHERLAHRRHLRRYHCPNNKWTGFLILLIGVVLLLDKTIFPMPSWVFTWPMLLIVLGLFIGVRHRFRHFGPFIPVLIGLGFLSTEIWTVKPDLRQLIWPLVVIIIGLLIIIRPKRRFHWEHWAEDRRRPPFLRNPVEEKDEYTGGREEWEQHWQEKAAAWHEKANVWHEKVKDWKEWMNEADKNEMDRIDSTAVFCGVRRNVLSKNFKGGESVTVFGGTEINLAQADLGEPAVLDVVVVFGGLKLVVPSNWEVRSNVINIFAGIDDKRAMQAGEHVPEKVLLITGTCLFGGIEIRSY